MMTLYECRGWAAGEHFQLKCFAISSAWVCSLVSDIKGGCSGVVENRVLRKVFGPKGDEIMRGGENCVTRCFVICILRQV
jgi:hypothetical protein